jgi:hypothetical protein
LAATATAAPCDERRQGGPQRRRFVAAEPLHDGAPQGAHYEPDPLLRRLELPDFEPFGSPPLEPLDEPLDRLELLRPDELLAALRRLPLDVAALERLELRDPLPLRRLLPLRLLPLSSPSPLRRLALPLLCDSRCCLTSPSSIVPRHSPSGSSFIIA